jgi:hypothetical protein
MDKNTEEFYERLKVWYENTWPVLCLSYLPTEKDNIARVELVLIVGGSYQNKKIKTVNYKYISRC